MRCITITIPNSNVVKLQILADLPYICKDHYEDVFFVAQYEKKGKLNFIVATDYFLSTVELFLSVYYPNATCHLTKRGESK